MLAGDTHGRGDHVEKLFHWAKKHEVDRVFQLGDWGGVWPSERPIDRKLQRWSKWAQEYGIPMDFIEGNHDHYDWLIAIGAWEAASPVMVAEDVTYHPRGSTFEIDGLVFLTMGGGVSIDKEPLIVDGIKYHNGRTEHESWWSQEMITDRQVARAIGKGKVDVLLSHDAPTTPELHVLLQRFSKGLVIPYKLDVDSRANRAQLDKIVEATKPKVAFHGHYHHRYNGWYPYRDDTPDTMVCGVDMNNTGDRSFVIIDTDTILTAVEEMRDAR